VISAKSSLVDVAFAVSTALDQAGIVAVLTGGSAATYHAPDAVQSLDLDFVITMHANAGEPALTALGYSRTGDYYQHHDSPFSLEFPPGPLGVGSDLIDSWDTVRRAAQVLYVLSATDSCSRNSSSGMTSVRSNKLLRYSAQNRATWTFPRSGPGCGRDRTPGCDSRAAHSLASTSA
jgi:hypothetical protein